jgi:hypothetical protein
MEEGESLRVRRLCLRQLRNNGWARHLFAKSTQVFRLGLAHVANLKMAIHDLTVNGIQLIINKGRHLLVSEVVGFLTRDPVQVGTQRRERFFAGHGFARLPPAREAAGKVIVGRQ